MRLLRPVRRRLLLLRRVLRLRLLSPRDPPGRLPAGPADPPLPGYFGSGPFSSGGEICEVSIADSVVPHFSRIRS